MSNEKPAQEPKQQQDVITPQLKQQLGELLYRNTILQAQLNQFVQIHKELDEENQELKEELEKYRTNKK